MLDMNLGPRVVISKCRTQTFAFRSQTLRNVHVLLVVQEEEYSVTVDIEVERLVGKYPPERIGMVVVPVDVGDRAIQRIETFADETEIVFPEADHVGIVEGVDRIVDQIARDGDEIGPGIANLYERLVEEEGDKTARAYRKRGGARNVMPEMEIGYVSNSQTEEPSGNG